MASTITLDSPELPTKAEGANGLQEGNGVQGSTTKGGNEDIAVSGVDGQTTDSIPPSPSPGSGSVSLRPNTQNGTTPGANTTPPLSVPQPKKFNHVNINKKFLEKTSSASSSGPSTSSLASTKAGVVTQKPTLQTAPSHSRLVTAKLTAGPQPSTITGPGWSRPSSTNSSVAPTPSATNPKPSPLPASSPNSSAPSLAPFGKIIQPQPRTSDQLSNKKDGSSKPAWGNTRASGSASGQSGSVQDEFPTAAEVAQVNSAKLMEKKQAAQAAAAQKQALAAEADAFRGVHLHPGHHWDEDEGDDDNFLENVIDFGDGRQYKIPDPKDNTEASASAEGGAPTNAPSKQSSLDQPVSKEERFGEDFDRTWPRNRGSTAFPSRDHLSRGPPSATSSHSPQEGSRVLFNERSNRLEPYSNHRYGAPRDSFTSRRDSRSDYSTSPTDMRGGRELPPHTQRQDGPRPRGFGDRPGYTSPFDSNSKYRDRDPPRRDNYPFGRSTSQGGRSRDGSFNSLGLSAPNRGEDRPRRLSTGPGGSPRDDGRQLPPHFSSGFRAPQRRSTSSDRRSPLVIPSDIPSGPQSALSLKSPAMSQATLSPLITESPLQGGSAMPLVDIDEVRRAAMHSAAERARIRRQQEEEEREKEKERARRKAAELEAKFKASEEKKEEQHAKSTEAQAIEIIEDALQSVSSGVKPLDPVPEEPSSSQTQPQVPTGFSRPRSTRGTLRTAPTRRTSFPSSTGADAPSPASEASSWRSKTLPPRPATQSTLDSAVESFVEVPPPTTTLPEVEHLTIKDGEDLEVIDFAEHGKLVGVAPVHSQPDPPTTEPPSTTDVERRRPRPLAIDFFDDDVSSSEPVPKNEEGPWRRKTENVVTTSETTGEVEIVVRESIRPLASAPPLTTRRRLSVSSDDHSRPHSGYTHPPHTPRSPQAPHYREAPMSALDDTMARIKGALVGMKKPELPKPTAKWLPPALRPGASTTHPEESSDREVFDLTSNEPPRSPGPVWNQYEVKLPPVSHPCTPLSKKQIHLSQTQPHVRSDIFSWDPPIEGMNRKDFQLNDILFRRPLPNKGPIKYIVVLPTRSPSSGNVPSKPVVHLPQRTVSGPASSTVGAFGKRREADGAASWRKPLPSSTKSQVAEGSEAPQVLDTVSRSPPPEAPASSVVPPTSDNDGQSLAVSVASSKTRPSKMPIGTDVGFYREPRSEQSPSEIVSFTVNSEIEDQPSQVAKAVSQPSEETSKAHTVMPGPRTPVNATLELTTGSSLAEQGLPTSVSKNETRKAEAQPSIGPITPPRVTISTPWPPKSPRALSLKDSPARPPDPEHLKAVWSQPSNKEAPSINSLERIGDDLAPVPFTISEVKSEDGETPPPTQSTGPSRMSLSDVTRAFQQVPTPSGSASRAASVSSPQTVHRQAVPSHPPPPPSIPNGNARPPYAAYPSQAMNSPSPTLVYAMPMAPSPIPRQMVPQQYSQPMWMPPANNMMRPMPPGYGSQFMPYPQPPPGAMYMSPLPGGMPPPMNGAQHQPHSMPMMSPMMAPAQAALPVYPGSPALVHSAPVMRVPSGTPYSPSAQPPPRNQVRGGYNPAPGMMPSPAMHPQNAYSTVPSNSLDRSNW